MATKSKTVTDTDTDTDLEVCPTCKKPLEDDKVISSLKTDKLSIQLDYDPEEDAHYHPSRIDYRETD